MIWQRCNRRGCGLIFHRRSNIRRACEALHCGRRQFLYGDLQVVNLAAELVRHPPLEVFPEIIRRGAFPDDVEAILVDGLSAAREGLASLG